MQWGDIGESGKTSTSYTADTTTVTQVDMLKADVDRLTIELGNVCRERKELKDLVREGCMNVDALNNTRPDINLSNYLMALLKLLKWVQKAKKIIKVAEGKS
jgi:hypothetical protein